MVVTSSDFYLTKYVRDFVCILSALDWLLFLWHHVSTLFWFHCFYFLFGFPLLHLLRLQDSEYGNTASTPLFSCLLLFAVTDAEPAWGDKHVVTLWLGDTRTQGKDTKRCSSVRETDCTAEREFLWGIHFCVIDTFVTPWNSLISYLKIKIFYFF